MTARRAYVVLGMHRSGTSSIAGALAKLGAAAPRTLLAEGPDNPRGFWESQAVVALNDRILFAGGSYWRDWRGYDLAALGPTALQAFRNEIAAVVRSEFSQADVIVLKDPRLCRLLPVWEGVLEGAGYDVGYILPVRSPLEVAASLARRNQISVAEGLLLWLRHVLDAERRTRGRPRHIILWNSFMRDWRGAMAAIAGALNWPMALTDAGAAQAVDAFLTDDLRNEVVPDADLERDPAAHAWAVQAYGVFARLAEDGESPALHRRLDALSETFDTACDLYGPAFQASLGQVLEAEIARDAARSQQQDAAEVVRRMTLNLMLAAEDHAVAHGRIADIQAVLTEREAQVARMDEAQASLAADLAALSADLDTARQRQTEATGAHERVRTGLEIRLAAEQALRASAEVVAARARKDREALEPRLGQALTDLSQTRQALAHHQGRLALEIAAHGDLRDALRRRPMATAWGAWSREARRMIARRTARLRGKASAAPPSEP